MAQMIGTGKIEVRIKADASKRLNASMILCKGVEFYGEKIAFSDNDGDLIMHDGNLLTLLQSDIYSIKTK